MEIITKETIINSLIASGYDRVDNFTYTYLLDKLINSGDLSFNFVLKDFSVSFIENVEVINDVYCIKNSEKERLHNLESNQKLMLFILNINTIELVKYKLNYYGFKSYYEYDDCFSSIEKEYRQLVFGSHYKLVVEDVDKNIHTIRTKKD